MRTTLGLIGVGSLMIISGLYLLCLKACTAKTEVGTRMNAQSDASKGAVTGKAALYPVPAPTLSPFTEVYNPMMWAKTYRYSDSKLECLVIQDRSNAGTASVACVSTGIQMVERANGKEGGK